MVKNILVVIDVQNDFIYGKFSTKQAQKIVKKIFQEINFNTVPYDKVIFTKDTHNFSDFYPRSKNTFENRLFPRHCERGTSGWDIVFPLLDCDGDKILKNQFDGSKRIIEYLEEEYPDFQNTKFNFYLCGVCTDLCVLATAIGLTKYQHINNIIVLKDLCAGTSPKKHRTAISALQPFGVLALSTTELQLYINALKGV